MGSGKIGTIYFGILVISMTYISTIGMFPSSSTMEY